MITVSVPDLDRKRALRVVEFLRPTQTEEVLGAPKGRVVAARTLIIMAVAEGYMGVKRQRGVCLGCGVALATDAPKHTRDVEKEQASGQSAVVCQRCYDLVQAGKHKSAYDGDGPGETSFGPVKRG